MQTETTKKYLAKRGWATFLDYTFLSFLSFFYFRFFGEEDNTGAYMVSGWPAMVPAIIWFIYIFLVEHLFGGTAGHLLLGLRVRSLTGGDISFWRTFKRRIADVVEISWCFGFIAWLIARNTPNNQRLGDLMAKTCVIGADEPVEDFVFDFEKMDERL